MRKAQRVPAQVASLSSAVRGSPSACRAYTIGCVSTLHALFVRTIREQRVAWSPYPRDPVDGDRNDIADEKVLACHAQQLCTQGREIFSFRRDAGGLADDLEAPLPEDVDEAHANIWLRADVPDAVGRCNVGDHDPFVAVGPDDLPW